MSPSIHFGQTCARDGQVSDFGPGGRRLWEGAYIPAVNVIDHPIRVVDGGAGEVVLFHRRHVVPADVGHDAPVGDLERAVVPVRGPVLAVLVRFRLFAVCVTIGERKRDIALLTNLLDQRQEVREAPSGVVVLVCPVVVVGPRGAGVHRDYGACR